MEKTKYEWLVDIIKIIITLICYGIIYYLCNTIPGFIYIGIWIFIIIIFAMCAF